MITDIFLEQALAAKFDSVKWDCSKPVVPVSIVSANFNNGRFLTAFFWSILNGVVVPKEIVVVDDGSSDGSPELLRRFSEIIPSLHVVYFEKNRGFGHALNSGIKQASCKYVARIDPDDVCGPLRLKRQFEELEKGDLDILGSDAFIFDSDTGNIVSSTNSPLRKDIIEKRILRGEHGVLHPTVTGVIEAFRETMYIQDNVPAEDYDIFARMFKAGYSLGNLKEKHLFYRTHSGSVSTKLKFSLINKTFSIRDAIFNTNTPFYYRLKYYIYNSSYRKYLYNNNVVSKLFWGGVASLFAPLRFISRMMRR